MPLKKLAKKLSQVIKIFLKHWIYEKCINILFDALSKNFQPVPGQIRVGDVFKTIEIYEYFYQSSTFYYNVILAELENITFFGEKMQRFVLQEVENKNQLYAAHGILKNFKK